MKRDLVDFLLSHVRQQPGMYLGRNKLSLLPTFIAGFMVACNLYDETKSGLDRFSDFHTWIEKNYSIGRPSSWTTPFLDKTNDNDEAALDLFFSELEIFVSSRTNQS